MRLILATLLLFSLALAPASQPASKSARISIKGMKFQPTTLTIKPGQTVTWINNDDRDHSVLAADASFKSGNLPGGSSFSFTFKKAGKFSYSCPYHPRMKAVIVVAE